MTLQIVSKGKGRWYLDLALRQARNVESPHDYIDFLSVEKLLAWAERPTVEVADLTTRHLDAILRVEERCVLHAGDLEGWWAETFLNELDDLHDNGVIRYLGVAHMRVALSPRGWEMAGELRRHIATTGGIRNALPTAMLVDRAVVNVGDDGEHPNLGTLLGEAGRVLDKSSLYFYEPGTYETRNLKLESGQWVRIEFMATVERIEQPECSECGDPLPPEAIAREIPLVICTACAAA